MSRMSFCTACGRRRSGSGQYCTACGAQFPEAVSGEVPVTPKPAVSPSAPSPDSRPDTMTAHAAPGVAAAEQAATPATDSPSVPLVPDADDQPETLAAYLPLDSFAAPGQAADADSAGSPARSGIPAADHGPARVESFAAPPPKRPDGRRRSTLAAVVAGAVVLVAGGGTVAWLTYHNQAKPSTPQRQSAPVSTTLHSTTQPSVRPTPSLAATPTPGPTPSTGGSLVALAPAIVQDSKTSRVEAFVNAYFTAINDHSFHQYDALLDPVMQKNETAQSFHSGYRTSTDSAATITSISTVSPGLVGATVTFVSHQRASNSATGTACTDWNVTLYLQDYAGHYLLGPAPPGYHATFATCS